MKNVFNVVNNESTDYKLWEDLNSLVQSNEAFFYVDVELNGWYRIFNYRLASYTDFQLPAALECRGIMFEITEEGPNAEFIRLTCRPMCKFFNLNENPFTMNLDYSRVKQITLKMDGSLISTYIDNQQNLKLKSKGSLTSEQANDAMDWLDNHPELKQELQTITRMGFTVNMEWTAPHNRIVIGYEQPSLTILNIRDMYSGEYWDFKQDVLSCPNETIISKYWVKLIEPDNPKTFIDSIPNIEDNIEGYVIELQDGTWFKCKTLKYLTQHRAKDSINSDRRLYEAVLAESTDDLRTLFHDDPLVVNRIEQMELKVDKLYNHLVDSVERFHARNKHLERKEYAILGQHELDRHAFALAMMLYVGKDIDYKEYMMKNRKAFGIKDNDDTGDNK